MNDFGAMLPYFYSKHFNVGRKSYIIVACYTFLNKSIYIFPSSIYRNIFHQKEWKGGQ